MKLLTGLTTGIVCSHDPVPVKCPRALFRKHKTSRRRSLGPSNQKRASSGRGKHMWWFPEILTVCAGIGIVLTMGSWLRFFVLKDQEDLLWQFEASGVVARFSEDGECFGGGRCNVLVIIDVQRASDAADVNEGTVAVTVRSAAFGLGRQVLRHGIRFEKKRATTKCLVDGTEYDLFTPFPVWKILSIQDRFTN